MRRISVFIIAFVIIITMVGCNTAKSENPEAIYVMKDCKEPIKPYIKLYKTNEEDKFLFMASGVSDYIAYGDYNIADNVLTLLSDDGRVYTFRINGTTLVFDAGNSSEIAAYKYFAVITDNTVFELEK